VDGLPLASQTKEVFHDYEIQRGRGLRNVVRITELCARRRKSEIPERGDRRQFSRGRDGKVVQKQGASEGVRAFGQMLEKDHSDANQKATAVAKSVNMTAPTAPNKKQKADYDKMSKLSGAKFDKEFAAHMVADHKKDIREYEKAAKKQDAVGNYAKETLPTLRKHLETAQSLNGTTSTANLPTKSPAVIAVPAPAAGVPAPAPETTGGEKVR
jgi:putative membrane protein